jgi:hypothetical protein
MTLLTIVGIWIAVSVPSSLLLASLMMVGHDRELSPVRQPSWSKRNPRAR